VLCLLLASRAEAEIVYPNMVEVCRITDCSVIVKPSEVLGSTTVHKVRLAFLDEPRMLSVVKCESEFRQFKKNGDPLISPTSDVGVMQINQVHWKEARKLGLDIFNNEDDNIKMGRIVYEKQGINAWSCNSKV